MEAELALLLTRVEADMAKHSDKDEQAFKYTHHMLEDMGARLSGIERTGVRFEADLAHRALIEAGVVKWLEKVDERLRAMERLVYIALGGVIVIGTLVSIIGGNILRLLSR